VTEGIDRLAEVVFDYVPEPSFEIVPYPEPSAEIIAGGMEILASLERLGAATAVSLDLPTDISYERYEAVGFALGRAHRTVAWMMGDWINHGEFVFGEKYAQAMLVTNMAEQTLMNYAHISRRIPRERRRAELPFSVHALVAPLEPQEQTAWLDRAVENDWKREDLREHLRPTVLPPVVGEVIELEEAARELVRSAKLYGNDFLVLRQPFVQLCVALGEEA
jgi:hypothetical protein